jgi:antitoxin component YwqK of YwqJK toxin-antitoxin module
MIVLETDPLLEPYDTDVNEGFMYSYDGIPFIGIIRGFDDDNILQCEYSYQDGYRWGLQREWHDNGQLRAEYTIGEGLYDGLRRVWDEQGNLTFSIMWIKGVRQP